MKKEERMQEKLKYCEIPELRNICSMLSKQLAMVQVEHYRAVFNNESTGMEGLRKTKHHPIVFTSTDCVSLVS